MVCARIAFMSGHSKWSTIKRQKGATDAKRGAVFTKLANAITIAVKNNHNPSTLIEKAKAANMSKDNIQRAIDRATSRTEGQLSEAIYEGFGPMGVAIIVETVSDNNARTSSEIRNIFNKHGGNLGVPGSVSYLFQRVGEIENETLEKALEVGALDFEDDILYTKPEDLHRISEFLNKPGRLIFRPNKETMIKIEDPSKLHELLEAIDELDDVQEVYTNVNYV